MTTVSQLIIDAHRQSNLIPINTDLSLDQETEGLRYLNRIVESTYGNEAGDALSAIPVGRNGVDLPQGFPWYDQVPDAEWFVPKNSRLILNLSSALTLYLHPMPDDGCRFGVVDTSGNLSTKNVTIDGNGRTVEGVQTIALSTNGLTQEWFYRQDLGNWYKLTNLAILDTFPFPSAFDDYFVTMLALRLNPAYGQGLDPQSQAVLTRSKSQLRARYAQHVTEDSEQGLVRMSANRGWLDFSYSDTSLFNSGRPR